LVREDLESLREFRCFTPPGQWYEREAIKALRQAVRHYAADDLLDRDRILLFERDDILHAVTVFGPELEKTAHLGFVGISEEFHGARIDSEDGDRLSDAVLDTTLENAAQLGFEVVTAQVAHAHGRSVAMLDRAGFERQSRYDQDYDLYAVGVG
jgi:RimJ/RimL family protein N-acetyltransferase